jgi:hypothetical protein
MVNKEIEIEIEKLKLTFTLCEMDSLVRANFSTDPLVDVTEL